MGMLWQGEISLCAERNFPFIWKMVVLHLLLPECRKYFLLYKETRHT